MFDCEKISLFATGHRLKNSSVHRTHQIKKQGGSRRKKYEGDHAQIDTNY